jgi:alkylation response protein AidB-like acyl-CoA dehydrogenase
VTVARRSLAVSEEHRALADAARRWTETHCPPAAARRALDAEVEAIPDIWGELVGLGWLGLHVDDAHGGEGYGLAELVVVVEALGRALAPGPFVPTVLASAAIQRLGTGEQRAAFLPGLVDGSTVGAVGVGAGPPLRVEDHGRGLWLAGRVAPVLGAELAGVFVLPVPAGWCVLRRDEIAAVEPLPSVDRTRRVGAVEVDGAVVADDRLLSDPGAVDDLAAVILGAEAVGAADRCLEVAVEHANQREQFGRPIGQFQAVKHACADLLLAVEQARSAVWDAARGGPEEEQALAAAVAGALAPEAAFTAAKGCIQVLGGIGFTWEHDAHLFLKRAASVRSLLGGPARWRRRALDLARRQVRRAQTVDLPDEAEAHREAVRSFLADLRQGDKATWNDRIAEAGYLAPHWPKPWGRDAGPVEQLVIDEEFRAASVRRRHLQVGAWVLPTLIAHGSPEQQERFIPPTLRGELSWCQMFSEPGAGSDLASLTTRAQRTDGGWLLTGQKVWTTMAASADWGLCLARTDADAPRHEGITCFLVDMSSDGLDVRPLRELTGQAMFNEVFMTDVFVPDDLVVGAVNDGWRCSRTTLENERVSMGSGSSFGLGLEGLLGLADRLAAETHDGAVALDTVGGLVVEAAALAALGARMTRRAVAGLGGGPEASVRKLAGVEHEQRVQEVGLGLLGAAGAAEEGEAAQWVAGFLGNRCLTIAGGTSEIQRNVIAERLLGLPRDP